MIDIRRAALDMLARREHSELQMQQKLLKKGFDPGAIQDVLAALSAAGSLSNTRFAESYLNSRRRKGFGPLRIRVELSARGLSEDVIEHHLNITDNAWFMHARQAWQKRFKGTIPADLKKRAQQMRFLQHRGFTPEQINFIFRSDHDDT